MSEHPIVVLSGLASQLVPDVAAAHCRIGGPEDGFSRRSYVRTVFALVEGLNHARLEVATESTHLSNDARQRATRAASAETAAVKAEAKATGHRPSKVVSMTRASCAALSAAFGVENPLSCTSPEWAEFVRAIGVRNRVTHPKSAADCDVSDEDLAAVKAACAWYHTLDMALLDRARGA